MKLVRSVPLVLLFASLAACNSEMKQQLATVAHTDSLRVDSLTAVRQELMQELTASTGFVTEINKELAKARGLAAKPGTSLETSAEMTATNEQRKAIVARITHLVARLDSVQNRLAATRSRVAQLTKQDSALVAQVAAYEKSVADLQEQAAKERTDFQVQIQQKSTEIAGLNSRIDTLNTVRTALVDTLGRLTTEKNVAYYVIGTKDELIKKGVLVTEGGRRFFLLGGRNVVPARELDPTNFSRIDRMTDRNIPLPEGQYTIFSRQNPAFTKPQAERDGKISGGLTIEQPDQFWANSRFLILVRG